MKKSLTLAAALALLAGCNKAPTDAAKPDPSAKPSIAQILAGTPAVKPANVDLRNPPPNANLASIAQILAGDFTKEETGGTGTGGIAGGGGRAVNLATPSTADIATMTGEQVLQEMTNNLSTLITMEKNTVDVASLKANFAAGNLFRDRNTKLDTRLDDIIRADPNQRQPLVDKWSLKIQTLNTQDENERNRILANPELARTVQELQHAPQN